MDLVTIRTFQNYFSAHILLTKLRSSGIECYLKDEFTVTVDPFLSNAVGGIKLVVKKEFEKEANEMLRLFDEEYMKSVVCPKCGSHSISLVPKQSTSNMVTAVLSWLFGNYAVSAENVYQCSNCKYESENLPENFADEAFLNEKDRLN
jgi:DNA-directed RNA polymerase subunit M/transcription elongation factor TFIIS